MSHSTVWRIGGWLNLIQTTFVGLLRVLSVPIVLMLSVASGYTTYYGLSFFITPWIAMIVTVAVQSIVVICSLELAGMHWRANPARFLSIVLSLLVALTVSVTFSYFKFYEFSQRDSILVERQLQLSNEMNRYVADVVAMKSRLTADQQSRIADASRETQQAYMGMQPGMAGQGVGKGKVWEFYNDILQVEQDKLKKLEADTHPLEKSLANTRSALQAFSGQMNDNLAYNHLIETFHTLQGAADQLASGNGLAPIAIPRLASFTELSSGITPSFDMWANLSWFALACAGMVDFFTLILSYRLEMTAPGPLSEEEKDLAFHGLRQFSQFTINSNDELEFSLERTELERARRVSEWHRMFSVAFLLNRGYLRKMNGKRVEFAPNLYPIVAERLARQTDTGRGPVPANDAALAEAMQKKFHG
jgi:hypothetical protein